jgi:glutathione peroxidase-family protein
MASATSFYDFSPLNKDGTEVPLDEYKGKLVLIVNTASECGFTPQYAGLESLRYKLRETHGDDFEVLGFPCNQFAGQEPGTDEDIQNFCQVNYGVSFPIMKKIDVNGDATAPLYDWLKNEHPGIMGLKRIKWNFEKFLIGRDGRVKGRWASITKPDSLEKPILEELEKPKPTTSGDLRRSEASTTDTDLKAEL